MGKFIKVHGYRNGAETYIFVDHIIFIERFNDKHALIGLPTYNQPGGFGTKESPEEIFKLIEEAR